MARVVVRAIVVHAIANVAIGEVVAIASRLMCRGHL